MKILIAFMIFALAFSGFSAASHAMGPDNCSSSAQIQDDNCSPDAQKSSDHAQKHDKSGKGFCLDCAHCCAASMTLSSGAAWRPEIMPDNYDAAPAQFLPQSQFSSLLRPPKTLA